MIISCNYGLIRTWLVTPAQFDAAPVGTDISVLSDNTDFPAPFKGFMTVATRSGASDKALLGAGWTDAPIAYPNGTRVIEGANITFKRVELVDPIPEISDADLMQAVTARGLIHSAVEVVE
jgi:hypothetical protein